MSISTQPYGRDPHGLPVTRYTMTNRGGASVSLLDFGGTVTHIRVPDKNGALDDVALGYADASGYAGDSGSMGGTIGRFGNRIADAAFELEGETFTLTPNNGPNNLHGGPEGFNVRMWAVKPIESDGVDTLEITLHSPDGDQGFPGAMDVTVRYSFDDECRLGIEYFAKTSKPTVVNLTNHAYFNLDGRLSDTVCDQVLQIFADSVTEVREGLIPTGKLLPTSELVYGFVEPTRIGDVLAHVEEDPDLKAAGGVDFNYCAGHDRETKLIATLYSPKTGREMKVLTDLPGVQCYTGQGLHQMGKDGVAYQPFGGVCLETQRYPDGIHHAHFPSVVLRPQEVYYTKTVYAFGIKG